MTKSAVDQDAKGTVNKEEIAHFSKLSKEWWDPKGPLMTLHMVTPFRMEYIRRQICEHFGRNPNDPMPLKGLTMLDVGCGGGLVTEPLARLGATVVGIDPSSTNVAVAALHAVESRLAIDYRAESAEAMAATGQKFDVVLSLEVVEHVSDVELFIGACGKMVKPRGLMVASTVNRTPQAFLLLIVAAEYVLRWIPRGTHHYDKLVTPKELTAAFNKAGLDVKAMNGAKYLPLEGRWAPTRTLAISYFMVGVKNRP